MTVLNPKFLAHWLPFAGSQSHIRWLLSSIDWSWLFLVSCTSSALCLLCSFLWLGNYDGQMCWWPSKPSTCLTAWRFWHQLSDRCHHKALGAGVAIKSIWEICFLQSSSGNKELDLGNSLGCFLVAVLRDGRKYVLSFSVSQHQLHSGLNKGSPP